MTGSVDVLHVRESGEVVPFILRAGPREQQHKKTLS
jgi:hypothetical protein